MSCLFCLPVTFSFLSILAEVPGLAAVPSTSFEHKPPQLGGRDTSSLYFEVSIIIVVVVAFHLLSTTHSLLFFKLPSIDFNRGLCLSPACRGVKLLSWR